MDVMTRFRMDEMAANGCDDVGCRHRGHLADPLYLHSRCHPGAPTWARYSTKTGAVTVQCARCDQEVMSFLVAE